MSAVAASGLVTVGAYVVGSILSAGFLWGISAAGFLSPGAQIILLAAVCAGCSASWFHFRKTPLATPGGSFLPYPAVVVGLIISFAIVFILARTETHFLGDGYTVLGALANASPVLKVRNFGACLTNLWLRDLLGGANDSGALMAFRVAAVTAGVLLLSITAIVAARLFQRMSNRVLFILAVATGGYALLFLGYVENYALFVALVGIYSLCGVLIAERGAPKWLILLPASLACIFHIFGCFLLPATIVLLCLDTGVSRWLMKRPLKTKLLISIVALASLIAAYFCLRTANLQYRFVLLPLVPDPFTVDGYTLASLKHLTDFANLLLLLVPGLLPLSVVALWSLRHGYTPRRFGWLLFLSGSLLAAVFVINPGLGMARDWDLLSFCGPPLLIALATIALRLPGRTAGRLAVAIAIVLGAGGLTARVMALNDHDAAGEQFLAFARRDPLKNQASLFALSSFYCRDSTALRAVLDSLDQAFPQHRLAITGEKQVYARNYGKAMEFARRALSQNPIQHSAHMLLGTAYLLTGRYDSALAQLQIADAMNPYNAFTYNTMATAYINLGRWEEAAKMCDQSLSVTESYPPLANAVKAHILLAHNDKAIEYYRRLEVRSDVPCQVFSTLAADFEHAGRRDMAVEAARRYNACTDKASPRSP